MIRNKEYVGCGSTSLIYKCNDGSALNVFYGDPTRAEKTFRNMKIAKEGGVNVPEAYELTDSIINEDDLDNIKFTDQLKIYMSSGSKLKDLVGKRFPTINREFIQGKTLYEKWLPSLEVRKKLKEQVRIMKDAEIKHYDCRTSNWVLTPDKEIYLVDCDKINPADNVNMITQPLTWFLSKRPPTCRLGELIPWLIYSALPSL